MVASLLPSGQPWQREAIFSLSPRTVEKNRYIGLRERTKIWTRYGLHSLQIQSSMPKSSLPDNTGVDTQTKMRKESWVLQMNPASNKPLGNSEPWEQRPFPPVHRWRSALFSRLRTEISICALLLKHLSRWEEKKWEWGKFILHNEWRT